MTNEPGAGGPWTPPEQSGAFRRPRSLRHLVDEDQLELESSGHPAWQRPGDRWSGQLREIDLRDRELTYRDLRYSPGEQPAEVRFDPVPPDESAPPADTMMGPPTFRDQQAGDQATTSAVPPRPEGFRPGQAGPDHIGPHVPDRPSARHDGVSWRSPTQRSGDVAARSGQVPLPAWHQGALVVVAALGTGASAYLLTGDTWGRTPMAVVSLIGIPGLAAASMVTAHHRLRPERRNSRPALAAAAGVALAAASLVAVWLLGTWAALASIAALVCLAWWATSPARGHLDVRDDAGRPMAPPVTPGQRRHSGRPAGPAASDQAAADTYQRPTSNLEAMMDVFAPDLPADRTTPVLELTPSPAAQVPASGARSSNDSGDLLNWITDTYSPIR